MALTKVTYSMIDAAPVNVLDYGVTGDGTTDDTAALITAFSQNGYIYVPAGNYLIKYAGANAGGVYVDLVSDTYIECHPQARFFTDAANGVDHDMIRFTFDETTATSPVTFSWSGGIIDQRNQKGSTSMPFTTNYPSVNPGTSATADGLSILGMYTSGGVNYSGIKKLFVQNVSFIASDDTWESAGGDSGLNCNATTAHVSGCYFKSNRDLGLYFSSDNTGDHLGGQFTCVGNTFETCMFGVTAKRGANTVAITGNTFENCIQAISAESVINTRSSSWTISGNSIYGYIWGIDLGSVDGATITGNCFYNAGVLLESGSAPTLNFTAPVAIQLKGTTGCVVSGNTIDNKISAFSGYTVEGIELTAQDVGSGSVNSDYVFVHSNIVKDIDVFITLAATLNNKVYSNLVNGTSDDIYQLNNNVISERGADLTIAGGVITVTNSYHRVDTESSAASDDLDTINGGVDGMRLLLRSVNSTRDVVVKNGTGNISLNNLTDFTLSQVSDTLELIYVSQYGNWVQLSSSNNGV